MSFQDSMLIPLSQAAKHCCYSADYLKLRARKGKLKAKKIGRTWVTTKEWVNEYVREMKDYKKKNWTNWAKNNTVKSFPKKKNISIKEKRSIPLSSQASGLFKPELEFKIPTFSVMKISIVFIICLIAAGGFFLKDIFSQSIAIRIRVESANLVKVNAKDLFWTVKDFFNQISERAPFVRKDINNVLTLAQRIFVNQLQEMIQYLYAVVEEGAQKFVLPFRLFGQKKEAIFLSAKQNFLMFKSIFGPTTEEVTYLTLDVFKQYVHWASKQAGFAMSAFIRVRKDVFFEVRDFIISK